MSGFSSLEAKEPDFAYPKTVLADAEKALAEADNGPARLRALIEIITANKCIDPDNTFAAPALIEEQLKRPGITEGDFAMFATLEAKVLEDIYTNDRYKYDRVDAPLKPFPAEINLWSGEQFRHRIDALYSSALFLARSNNVLLDIYANSLDSNAQTFVYFPDIVGFVAYKYYYFKQIIKQPVADFAKEIADTYTAGSAPYFWWSTCAITKSDDSKKAKTERLLELYNSYDTEAALYPLFVYFNDSYSYAETESSDAISRRDKNIKLIEAALAKYPSYWDIAFFKNTLNNLKCPKLNVWGDTKIAPGTAYKVKATTAFVDEAEFSLYRLGADAGEMDVMKIVKSQPRVCRTTIDIAHTDSTFYVEFPISEPGKYAVVASFKGCKEPRCIQFEATPILPICLNGLGNNAVAVVDFTTGAPLRGVITNINTYYWRNSAIKTEPIGTTDDNGILRYTAGQADRGFKFLSFKYKGYKYDFDRDIQTSSAIEREKRDISQILVFTDRQLYHPGDSIQWAVVVIKDGAPMANKTVNIIVQNSNHEKVATLTATTDAFGRAHGSFATAKEGLTGYWALNVTCEKGHAYERVLVSDFKLPTYTVEITSIERGVPSEGCVRLGGKATTFAGMPVAGAKVQLDVMGATRWRWFRPAALLGRLDGTTGADGSFSIDISKEMLEQKANGDEAYTDFYATATVTASDAETASISKGFTTGKPYMLEASTPKAIVDTDNPLPVRFAAYDANGNEATIALRYYISNAKSDEEFLKGEAISSGKVDIDIKSLKAGEYKLSVYPADAALADSIEALSFTAYNRRLNEIPNGQALFVPDTQCAVDGGKCKVLVGVIDASTVYYATYREDKLLDFKPVSIRKGFSEISIPCADDKIKIQLFCTKNGKVYSQDISQIKEQIAKPEIKVESFRDKLIPGDKEQWRFRLLDARGSTIADAAMIATLYNRALDEIEDMSWPQSFSKYTPYYYLSMSSISLYQASMRLQGSYELLKTLNIKQPSFRYLNQVRDLYFTLGNRMMMKSAAAGTNDINYLAAPTSSAVAEMADMEEDMEEASLEAAPDSDNGGAAEKEPGGFDYRVAELLQAFWKPTLTADAEGNIDICFTVPNAIGAWQLRTFAWSRNLEAATYAAECVANKPVMVQPNLPRFLRQGDKARVLATVFNNSDADAEIITTIEIFDIATGAIISTFTSTDNVAAKGSALVGADVTAPVDAAAIGYRVRSTHGKLTNLPSNGTFADGEQAAIPVLASASTVIESTEFYLNPNDAEPFTLTVDAAEDASLTLQYCQNPIWTAVKAMRGIAGSDGSSSSALARKLFSCLAADKIVNGNHDVAKALKLWADNPSEGALASMLSKNDELKRLMLDQTPWVQAAASESARMEALAQVLDPVQVAAAKKAATDALLKLQNADGGFAWTSWSNESSEWCTESVLMNLGLASSLGMPLGNELTNSARRAFYFMINKSLEPKRPKTDPSLALICALLPQFDSTKASALLTRTKQEMAKDWKKASTGDKGWYVLVLKRDYPGVAAQIMESLRQYGVEKPGMGMCFPSVSDIRSYANIIQAYAAMQAPAGELDALRQWVIVQAQANDDFGTYNPDYIIAALMLTGSDWTSAPMKQNVLVDGKALEIGKIESATGYFSQTLPTAGHTTVTITPNGITPSYGSVISIHRQPMTEIAARPGRDLSIEKRVLVQRDGKWVEANEFALGERLRVQLTIVAKRTLEYVSIDDERPAAFEPVDQLPGYIYEAGLIFYRENRDASTRIFISYLPKGTYHLTYDMTANLAGSFISGIATLQSQYAPELTAHSGGSTIEVK